MIYSDEMQLFYPIIKITNIWNYKLLKLLFLEYHLQKYRVQF